MRIIPAKVNWSSFLVGTAVSMIAGAVARPLLVGTMRAGYGVADAVNDAWSSARTEVREVKHEALAQRHASNAAAEVQQLRAEVASLKAQLGKR